MDPPSVETVFQRIAVYYLNGLCWVPMDTEQDRGDRKTGDMAPKIILFWARGCPLGQHQALTGGRTILLGYSQKRQIHTQAWCTSTDDKKVTGKGWKDRNRHKHLAYSLLQWWNVQSRTVQPEIVQVSNRVKNENCLQHETSWDMRLHNLPNYWKPLQKNFQRHRQVTIRELVWMGVIPGQAT